MKSFAA
jgi:hypothetical protein